LRDLYLVLHILLAAAWIGGGLAVGFLLPRMQKSGAVAARAFFLGYEAMGKIFFNVAGVGVLITGILLVLDGGFEFEDTFVVVGFIAVIIGAILGMAGFAPLGRKLLAAYDKEDAGAVRALTQRFSLYGIIDSVILVVALVAMVYQWGTPG
jgi:putative copper export protein